MKQLADFRDGTLRKHPVLKSLFFELTDACNEHCRHCGSRCGESDQISATGDRLRESALNAVCDETKIQPPMSPDEWMRVLDEVKGDFDITQMRLCITGGEPLLYQGFREVMEYAHQLGFRWGMTSNGILIDEDTAAMLADTGMRTISISIDGMQETHDWFRRTPGGYERAMRGIRCLVDAGRFEHVQITTVVHHRSIDELDELYDIVRNTGVRSWRVINIEPIGRAKDDPELMLTPDELRRMMDFIEEKRRAGGMPVTYGCSHYLGPERERESRQWYFLCNAGVYTASITHTGDCVACLDIPRRPELVQGNIRHDRLSNIWENRYDIFRTDYRKRGKCADCKHYRYCAGDSFHTWDFDRGEPGLCMMEILQN